MRYRVVIVSVAGCLLLLASAAHATFLEDFSGGLTAWSSEGADTLLGDVSVVAETACIADELDWYTAFYQAVLLPSGFHLLEFDFLGAVSADTGGVAPDVFFASLYFANDAGAFDLATATFDDVMPLMDLDALGPYNVAGAITPSALGGDWLHFSSVFWNSYAYAIPTFELLDQNLIPGDSLVCLDNISIVAYEPPIPEPASVMLLGLGLGGLAYRAKRRFGRN